MNQAINFFWTILGFAPMAAYWFSAGFPVWFYLFIVISVIPVFLSQKMFNRLFQLSNNTGFYESLGVRFIRKFVRHGDIANSLARKKVLSARLHGKKLIRSRI